MLQEDYKVRLDAFEGPLDLLLHLIRRAEVDIAEIPIAQVTDQYLAHLDELHTIDIDLAGEFLVMAATLMEIKSRTLAPKAEDEPDEPDSARSAAHEAADPRAELIGQLLAYQKTRDAADVLGERLESWSSRRPAGGAGLHRESLADAVAERMEHADIEDLGVFDLVEAYERVLASVNFDTLGDHHVRFDEDDTPIELHAADLVDRLARLTPSAEGERSMTLKQVFDTRRRSEVIGLFLAMLELIRQRRVAVRRPRTEDEWPVVTLLDGGDSPGETSLIEPLQNTGENASSRG